MNINMPCSSFSPYDIPNNGALYTEQSAFLFASSFTLDKTFRLALRPQSILLHGSRSGRLNECQSQFRGQVMRLSFLMNNFHQCLSLGRTHTSNNPSKGESQRLMEARLGSWLSDVEARSVVMIARQSSIPAYKCQQGQSRNSNSP